MVDGGLMLYFLLLLIIVMASAIFVEWLDEKLNGPVITYGEDDE